MRACAGVALVLMAVSATFGLAGCAAIDDLRDTLSRWFDAAPFPGGRGVIDNDVPETTPKSPPEKPLKTEATKASKTKHKPARKLQQPQTAEPPKKPPIPDSTVGARPPDPAMESAPPKWMRLPTPWPEAPPPGTFSR
jgi:hypothetical protein